MAKSIEIHQLTRIGLSILSLGSLALLRNEQTKIPPENPHSMKVIPDNEKLFRNAIIPFYHLKHPKPVIPPTERKAPVQTQANSTPLDIYSAKGQLGAFSVTCYDLTGRTATGRQAGWGSIAVDPRVIPYGSELWVPGYGIGTADDTGSAIVGRRLDIWMASQSSCLKFGRQVLNITKIS